MRRARERQTTTRWALAAIAVLAMAAACSSGSSDSTASMAAPANERANVGRAPSGGQADAAQPAAATFKVDATGTAVGSTSGDAATPVATGVGSFISTGTMTVRVDDVAVVKPKVVEVVQGMGGGVFGEETTLGTKARSLITVKVPPARFADAMSALAGLGTLASQQVKTDDVTQQVVDLEARLTAAEASLLRTRDLLGRAATIAEITQLEGEVVRRQADVESLRGQLKTIRARIDLATINVTFEADGATPAIEQRDEEKRRQAEALPGFGDGWRGGLDVAGDMVSLAAAATGALLPFLPLLIAVVLLVRFVRRGQRGAEAEPAASATAAG